MDTISWKATDSVKTVGELKKILGKLSDDTPLKRSSISKAPTHIRYEEETVTGRKWILIGN